jgi:hypothetical protein
MWRLDRILLGCERGCAHTRIDERQAPLTGRAFDGSLIRVPRAGLQRKSMECSEPALSCVAKRKPSPEAFDVPKKGIHDDVSMTKPLLQSSFRSRLEAISKIPWAAACCATRSRRLREKTCSLYRSGYTCARFLPAFSRSRSSQTLACMVFLKWLLESGMVR